MPEPKEPNYNPYNGMRLPSEGDRTPEYIRQRDEFVVRVNDWLNEVKKAQEAGVGIGFGSFELPITDHSRINHTLLQPGGSPGSGNGRGLRTIIESLEPGVSLQGDGFTSPLVFQGVLPYKNGRMVVEVIGTDPLSPVDENGDVIISDRNNKDMARVHVRRQYPTEDGWASESESYVCRGHGQLAGAGIGIGGTMPQDAERAQFMNIATAEILNQLEIGANI